MDHGLLLDGVKAANAWVWNAPEALPWLVAVLLGSGIYVTIRLRLIQLRRLRHAVDVARGVYDKPEHDGDISHFQALSTALSATVGIGNIAGVALAIHLGGPGALFWMWVTAALGMALKYAECTLSMHYRSFDEKGNAAGGPMYYIEKGLGARWKPLAVIFATCGAISSFGSGNMNQANTIAASAYADFGWNKVVVGIVVALLVASVILGGIKRIGWVASKLAPLMAVLYVLGAVAVLVFNIADVPAALWTIVRDAFNPSASVSGSVAGVFMTTVVWGVRRGLFSNEAGQGSAPIAHAAAKTDEPVREGTVAMLGPLIDTLIICSMTGLVIVTTGVWDEKHFVERSLTEVQPVPAAALVGADSEFARVEAARDAARDLQEAARPPVEIMVDAGRQPTVAFLTADGIVDEATLVDAATGNAYSGPTQWMQADGRVTGPDGVDLRIRGRALLTGSPLTALAFQRGLAPLGDWGNTLVTVCVFLFAISTMISWSYYGDRCVEYLFGIRWVVLYRAVFCFFVFLGAWLALEVVWEFGDLALGLMAVPNLIAVVLLTPKLVALTRDYFARNVS